MGGHDCGGQPTRLVFCIVFKVVFTVEKVFKTPSIAERISLGCSVCVGGEGVCVCVCGLGGGGKRGCVCRNLLLSISPID
jgi:hypothetical protein